MLPLTVSMLRAPGHDGSGYRPEDQARPCHVLSPAGRERAAGDRLTRIFHRRRNERYVPAIMSA